MSDVVVIISDHNYIFYMYRCSFVVDYPTVPYSESYHVTPVPRNSRRSRTPVVVIGEHDRRGPDEPHCRQPDVASSGTRRQRGSDFTTSLAHVCG